MIGPAEAQRVLVGDRSRAHREDVAQYAADAGRRPLVRLDVAGVVVALHLEDGCQTVANVDHAGILAGSADHLGPGARYILQVNAARLVGAMPRPPARDNPDAGEVREERTSGGKGKS